MNPPPNFSRVRQLAPLALVLASAAIAAASYLQALGYPFISDDYLYLVRNAKLLGLRLAELWRVFTEPYNPYEFLPLRDISYWFDMALFGLNPSAFRMHNIILYLICLPFVYGATAGLWRYFRPADIAGAPWAAAAATALFALHPSHVEAVVWISGRKDVLSTLFSLLALWLAVSARRERGISMPHAASALAALLAAMLSKAAAVTVAPVIALLWVLFWRDIPVSNRRYSLLLWPLASLLLAACTALFFVASSTVKLPAYFGVEAIARALAILGKLARLSVSPENRHFYYPVFEDPYLPAMLALGVAVLAAAAIGMMTILRRRSLVGFAWITFLLLCMPYMQLIPYNTPTLVADRWLTLAVWPAALLVVALSWCLKPVPRTVLLLAIALPWGFQTIERPRDWRSFEALVDTDLRAFPGYYMPAALKICTIQLPQGLYREANETANSITIPELRDIMVRMVKADYAVHVDAVATGMPQKAMALLWELFIDLEQPPVQAKWNLPVSRFWLVYRLRFESLWDSLAKHFHDDASVRYNAGLWMLKAGKHNDAATHFRAAIKSQNMPESMRGTAFRNLGLALLNSGQIAEAEASLLTALEQPQPDLRAYCLLSSIYKQSKRFAGAARAEAECRKQAPVEGMAR